MPDPISAAIQLDSVIKRYGDTLAVDGLTLSIPRGELFAFVGPNGAGKTTTIKMIAGLLRPDAGEIHLCGHAMHRNGQAAKSVIAYVPDQPFLYDKLTGREFLHFVARMYGVKPERRDAVLTELNTRFQMAGFLDKMTEDYSHGMKQKVVIAAALLHAPEVLVIDEPMVGLDPKTVREVKDLFTSQVRRGGTVFMSTHTLEVAEAIADRIGIINRGQLIAAGTMSELRALADRSQSLEEIFLELTEEEDEPTR
ncbi:MAG TPA: ABC transporter ATP-binding protein [Phycisphaerae bacterium]|nr:ABC transporter ATP-binding protein [Phycisphaerae bacterium]